MADFDPSRAQDLTAKLSADPLLRQLYEIRSRLQAGAGTPQDYATLQQIVGQSFENTPDRLLEAANLSLMQRARALGLPGGGSGYTLDPESNAPTVRETEGVPGWAKAAGIGVAGLAAAPFAMNALGIGGAAGSAAPGTIGGGAATVPIAGGTAGGMGSLGGMLGGGGLIPTLISAGTRLGGALLGSHAAGKAAQQQEAAIQQALNLNRDIYGQTMSGLNPYIQMGPQSLTRLSQFVGMPGPSSLPMNRLGGR